jgi:hypothetical protein
MMNRALRRVDDAMAAALEESDLRVARVATDRKSRAVTVSVTG